MLSAYEKLISFNKTYKNTKRIFHGYWKGSGQNKQFEVKWRYATFVNFST